MLRMIPLVLPAVIPVAGVSFRQEVASSLSASDRLMLVEGAGDAGDADACRVVTPDGGLVGYVPRPLVRRVRAALPLPSPAEVVEVLGTPGRLGLRIRIGGPDAAEAPVPPADGAPAPKDGLGVGVVEVLAASGRRLGVLVGSGEGRVSFRTDSGAVLELPEGMVRCVTAVTPTVPAAEAR